MEPSNEVSWKCIASKNGQFLNIQCQDSHRYVELEGYLEKTRNDEHRGPSPEVILRFGEAEVAVHATLLAALSSSWREYLHNFKKDIQIILTLALDIPVGHKFLSALKSLLYCGETVVSEIALEHVVTSMNNLNLNDLRFTYCDSSNAEKVLRWEGHHDLLMKGLQQLCIGQLCSDLSIFVKGHLIKVHRYIFCAFSPLLESIFADSKKPILFHLPGFSVESVQNLVSLMYFGKANIEKHLIQEFCDLCKSLGINSFEMETKRFCIAMPKEREGKIIDRQKCDSVCFKPEIKYILQRLTALYNVKSKKDLTLLVDGKRMTTNKAILSVFCPNVHSLLMEEDTDEHSVILISDADYNSVRCLLSVIYKGSCSVAEEHCNIVSSYLDKNIVLSEIDQGPEEEKKIVVQHSKDGDLLRKLKRNRNKKFSSKRSTRKPFKHKLNYCCDASAESATLEYFAPGEEGKLCRKNRTGTISVSEMDGCMLHVNSSKNCRSLYETSVPSTSAENTNMASNHTDELKSRERCRLDSLYEDDEFGQCLHCGIKFMSVTNLHCHMKSHLETPSVSEASTEMQTGKRSPEKSLIEKDSNYFPCDICDRMYRRKAELKHHMIAKHSLELKSNGEFYNSKKITSAKQLLMCLECKTTFRTRKLLKTHIKSDHKKDMFHCSKCSAAFYHPDELRHHREGSHPVLGPSSTEFTCNRCNRNFRRKAAMNAHQQFCRRSCNQSSVLATSECSELETDAAVSQKSKDIKLLTQENLHKLYTAGFQKSEKETQDSDKNLAILAVDDEPSTVSQNMGFIEIPISEATNFACPECGEIFDSIEEFTVHAEQEGHGQLEKSRWICGICGSVFLEESELTEHFSSHSPFPVEYYLDSGSPKKKVIYQDIEGPHNVLHHMDNNVINSCDCIQQEEQNIIEGTSKIIIPHRAEADSSVMDGEKLENETVLEYDKTSDSDMDVVTSSMNY